MSSYLARVERAIHDLQQGKMVILTDNSDREDEADIIFPAENASPEMVNFMLRHSSGIICLSITAAQFKQLGLSLMVPASDNTSQRATPFAISIDAKEGISTGVSAVDRATTIRVAVNAQATADDIVMPGHIFPLLASVGGVLQRDGHTEGATDIVRMAGFKPAAVLCELMNLDGTMMRDSALIDFAKQHELTILSIADIIHYRRRFENLIQEEASTDLPLQRYGKFSLTMVKEKFNDHEHLVLTRECATSVVPPLVRIHSSCVTGDLFGSERCDCGLQLEYSLSRLAEEGGILIYLNQEGRGIGLFNKIKSYTLQEGGMDTIEANLHLNLPVDSRDYYIAAHILRNRNIHQVRLLTNNPAKVSGLQKYGIESVIREPLPIFWSEHNRDYLLTKKEKLDHYIEDCHSA